jgi:hypothetical protein
MAGKLRSRSMEKNGSIASGNCQCYPNFFRGGIPKGDILKGDIPPGTLLIFALDIARSVSAQR